MSLLLLVLPLAACGGSSGALSVDPVAQAAVKTGGQKSIRMTFSVSGGGVSGTGSGVFNNGDSAAGRLSMDLAVNGQTVHMDAITQGFVIYIKSPIFTSDPSWPKDKTWLKIDLKKAAQQHGIDLGVLTSTKPTDALAYLRGSDGKVTKVGKETVAGVETTHYAGTVDLEKAAREASGDEAATLRKAIQVIGTKRIPVDVWVDGDGLVRKVSYKQQSAMFTTVLTEFGQPVAIEAPADDEVLDGTKYAGTGG